MEIKDIIKADPDTFWRWAKKNPISHPRPVYITPDKAKALPVAQGKNRKPV